MWTLKKGLEFDSYCIQVYMYYLKDSGAGWTLSTEGMGTLYIWLDITR